MQPCPSPDQLRQLVAEELQEPEASVVAAHIDACTRCQEVLEQLTDCRGATSLADTSGPRSTNDVSPEARAFLDRLKSSDPSRPPPDDPPAEGLPQVAGYDVLEFLGTGGAGSVYKARDRRLDRLVALKLFAGLLPSESRRRDSIRKEAEAAARLHHPHIVQIYEIGETAGRPYLALELVHGPTLAQHLEEGPLPPSTAATLLQTLANAVHHAHERGIVHRDLKPANILLQIADSDGQSAIRNPQSAIPKITDFGLAKRMDEQFGPSGTGAIMGTPGYMSPEQASGRNREVGPATDVHALGAILYEALTGRPPFRGSEVAETLDQIRYEEPVPPARLQPGIPPDLQTITLKCLQKEPRRRYASALALAEDLRRFLAHEPINARPPSLWYQGGKFVRRNKGLVGGAAGILLAILGGAVLALLFALGEARQRRVAETNRERANANAVRADAARQEAVRQAYQARLAAAQAALGESNLAEAGQQLQAAPEALRGWEWRHLHQRLLDQSPAVVPQAETYGGFVGFFPAGQRLVAFKDRQIRLVDARSGAVLRRLPDGVNAWVSPTRSGPLLLICEAEHGSLDLVNQAGEVRRTPCRFGPGLWHVTVSPDASRAVAFFQEDRELSRLLLVDLSSGKPLLQLPARTDQVFGPLAFSPDGSRVAGPCSDWAVHLWDVATGTETAMFRGHTSQVLCVTFSPDGRRLLSGSVDQTVRQWDVSTGRQLDVRRGHTEAVRDVAYSPDGQWFASASIDHTVRVWRTDGSEATAVLAHPEQVIGVAFSADGASVASRSENSAHVWPAPSRADPRVLSHTSYVYPVTYSPDGRRLASGGWDKTIRLWDATSAAPVAVLKGHDAAIFALAFSPDGRRLVSGDGNDQLRIWDTATGQTTAVLRWASGKAAMAGSVHSVVITPDSRRLGFAEGDHVQWVNLETGKELGRLPLPLPEARVLALSPDGRLLAAAAMRDPVIAVLALDTGQVRALLHHESGFLQSLAFSPDGRQLLSAGQDRVLRLWDAETGELVRAFQGHTDEVFAADFHPDGRRIASGGRDRVVRIWDRATGDELLRLRGHTSYIFSLAWSPDGSTLASASGDSTVRLWDTLRLELRLRAGRQRMAHGQTPGD